MEQEERGSPARNQGREPSRSNSMCNGEVRATDDGHMAFNEDHGPSVGETGKSRSCSRDGEESGRGPTTTLYVSNLPRRCGPREVRRVFEEIGEVQDCRIISNPVSRESRGFAFVTFVDPNLSSEAIERLDGKAFIGESDKPIRVERAKRNKPHNPTPGFYKGPAGPRDRPPYRSNGYGGSRNNRGPGRWEEGRNMGSRNGYGSYGGGRNHDRYDQPYQGGHRDAYEGRQGNYGYDRERNYSSNKGHYDGRSGYDKFPHDDRSHAMYKSRPYDRGSQYEEDRGDRYNDYGGYYGGPSQGSQGFYGGKGERDGRVMHRERSRS